MKSTYTLFILGVLLTLVGCDRPEPAAAPTPPTSGTTETAIFAGGCFWCMEKPFDVLPGVRSTTSGYTDGHKLDPTYKEVSAGGTGHTEAIRIEYDPAQITYAQLLQVFWRNIDPVAKDRQFCDSGTQYRSGIYYQGAEQQRLAEASKQKLLDSKVVPRIHTEIKPATKWYDAEDYHQDYYLKNPKRYAYYRYSCGRDKRLKELWSDVPKLK